MNPIILVTCVVKGVTTKFRNDLRLTDSTVGSQYRGSAGTSDLVGPTPTFPASRHLSVEPKGGPGGVDGCVVSL